MKRVVVILLVFFCVCASAWCEPYFTFNPTFGLGSYEQNNISASVFTTNVEVVTGAGVRIDEWHVALTGSYNATFGKKGVSTLHTGSLLLECGVNLGEFSSSQASFTMGGFAGYNFALYAIEGGFSIGIGTNQFGLDLLRLSLSYSPVYDVFKCNLNITMLIVLLAL